MEIVSDQEEGHKVESPKNASQDDKENTDSEKDKELMHGFTKEVLGKTAKEIAEPSSSLPFKWPETIKPDGTGSNMVEHPILNEIPKQENATGV